MTILADHRSYPLAGAVLVLGVNGFEAVGPRRYHVVSARLRGRSLDRRLAAGDVPESDLLLAVRAAHLVSSSTRHRLARRCDDIVRRGRRPDVRSRAAVPPPGTAAAVEQIRIVADLLRADRPVSARGVALVKALLPGASTPLRDLRGAAEDLAAAIARSIDSP